jgi:hypothetical protein
MADDAPDWSPAKSDENGFALHGDYPLNSRLRAEAFVRDGVSEDPDGLVSVELIADTAARLDNERKAAEEEARNAPSMRWTEAKLREHAATLPGVVITADDDKAQILAAIEGATSAVTQES